MVVAGSAAPRARRRDVWQAGCASRIFKAMLDTSALEAALEGRYALEGELGVGGMATVYLAHDLRHERKVALEILRPELTPADPPRA